MTSNANISSDSHNLSNGGGGGASSSATDQDPIYALPKVYNGKTVTDLFPEFKYDTVRASRSLSFSSALECLAT